MSCQKAIAGEKTYVRGRKNSSSGGKYKYANRKTVDDNTAHFVVERDVREVVNCEEQSGDKSRDD